MVIDALAGKKYQEKTEPDNTDFLMREFIREQGWKSPK